MNELIFFSLLIFLASTLLIALKAGKIYVFAVIAILSVLLNVFVLKPFTIFGLTTYGGNVMYGCIFFATDLLAEHYSKKEALKGVKIGFLSLFLYFVVSTVYVYIAPDLATEGGAEVQNAIETLFLPAGGIVVASITAFLISNTSDIFIYDFLHKKTGEKFLWIRNNLSTITSQFLDTIIFTSIAVFFGFFDIQAFWEIVLFAYVFKVLVAVLDTPFLYLSKIIIKK